MYDKKAETHIMIPRLTDGHHQVWQCTQCRHTVSVDIMNYKTVVIEEGDRVHHVFGYVEQTPQEERHSQIVVTAEADYSTVSGFYTSPKYSAEMSREEYHRKYVDSTYWREAVKYIMNRYDPFYRYINKLGDEGYGV